MCASVGGKDMKVDVRVVPECKRLVKWQRKCMDGQCSQRTSQEQLRRGDAFTWMRPTISWLLWEGLMVASAIILTEQKVRQKRPTVRQTTHCI